MDDPGFGIRDAVVAGLGLLTASMGWIFKKQDSRLTNLEGTKVDKATHDEKFKEVLRRLEAQDEGSLRRDDKLDKILDKLASTEVLAQRIKSSEEFIIELRDMKHIKVDPYLPRAVDSLLERLAELEKKK